MCNFANNINNDVRYVLMSVRFSPNDYLNHVGKIDLSCIDRMLVKEISADDFVITLLREIRSSDEDFFNISVSFDIYGTFINTIDNPESVDHHEFIDSIVKEKRFLIDNCTAKISLMISQISAQIGMSIPIITPAYLLDKKED